MSRSYNIVRPRFWTWAKEKELNSATREFALYTLTSEHTTGIGCYRLPIAYAAEDLGTVPATVRKTISELTKVGFLRHDESTGWVFIPGFLDHNPIANSNVGKSLVPFVEAVPRRLPFYADFIDALERANVASADGTERFPEGFIDRLRNGIGNGMPDGSANGMPTHDHDHEPEHDHDAGAAGDDPHAEQAKDEEAAFSAWNEAAERVGRWPKVRKLEGDRRKAIRARINSVGGIGPFLEVLSKAEASRFVREQMTAFSLDWLLKPANWRKLSEGNYDDGRQGNGAETHGRAAALVAVADRLREQEQHHGG